MNGYLTLFSLTFQHLDRMRPQTRRCAGGLLSARLMHGDVVRWLQLGHMRIPEVIHMSSRSEADATPIFRPLRLSDCPCASFPLLLGLVPVTSPLRYCESLEKKWKKSTLLACIEFW